MTRQELTIQMQRQKYDMLETEMFKVTQSVPLSELAEEYTPGDQDDIQFYLYKVGHFACIVADTYNSSYIIVDCVNKGLIGKVVQVNKSLLLYHSSHKL